MDIIAHMDCLDYMETLPDDSIDLVVTSPPYAKQRRDTYGGISEKEFPDWFQEVGRQIYRVLKPSGSFVLNIKEHVSHGCRSTYVLKTVFELVDIFCWVDTYIWHKTNPFPTGSKRRLKDGFEYCYLFTKTLQYQFFPEHVLQESTSKWAESEKRRKNKGTHPVRNGSGMDMGCRCQPDLVRPSNVLVFPVDTTNHNHPATFPVDLPDFFIRLLTKEGDLVYDPVAGSGTTLYAAKQLHRHYLGSETIGDYVSFIQQRIGCDCVREGDENIE